MYFVYAIEIIMIFSKLRVIGVSQHNYFYLVLGFMIGCLLKVTVQYQTAVMIPRRHDVTSVFDRLICVRHRSDKS